jgi:hypothetical protein
VKALLFSWAVFFRQDRLMVGAAFFLESFFSNQKEAAGSGSGVFPANTNSATLGVSMMSHVQEHGFLGLSGKIILEVQPVSRAYTNDC